MLTLSFWGKYGGKLNGGSVAVGLLTTPFPTPWGPWAVGVASGDDPRGLLLFELDPELKLEASLEEVFMVFVKSK